uniref:Reverse transcriptase/retrotransposon-derived protein RNase H-like domain-containing protein n=1 Tax=Solanum lycopersicum TaxID=4081 RepID=A0A3Q7IZN3_SOLLC
MALHILIDTGSSHNFIGSDLVKKLGCEVKSINTEVVAAANGSSCGVVLGVQWLLTLGDVKMNFRSLTMEFWYRGRKHLLRGSGSHVLTSSVSKHSGNQSQLCMIQVVPQGSDEMKGHLLENEKQAEENPAILEVLSEFSALFDDPIGLPPSRVELSMILQRRINSKWNSTAQQAFVQLKEALTQAPILALSDASKTFIVETDASGYGIGVALMQEGRLIAFISKPLYHRHVALTDQKALKFLIEQKLHSNSQLLWLTKLMRFDYSIEYKRGIENKVTEAFSRELHQLITELEVDPTSHKQFTWLQGQLRRKMKLVIGNVQSLRTDIVTLWHAGPHGGHSEVEATLNRLLTLFY